MKIQIYGVITFKLHRLVLMIKMFYKHIEKSIRQSHGAMLLVGGNKMKM